MNARQALAKVQALAVATTAVVLLVSCGGGTQVEAFRPVRIVSFGDEISRINSDGTKYSVNYLDPTTAALTCATYPIWNQYLASSYGFVFPECNPNGVAVPQGTMKAAAGAKSTDLAVQIDDYLTARAFTNKDLVTVLVGMNDILEQYALYNGTNEAQLAAQLAIRGATVGGQIQRIANLGAKVIVSTVPDLGVTPFAVGQEAMVAGRAALISRLTLVFNENMRGTIENDGHKVGLIQADSEVRKFVVVPVGYGFTNVTQASCATAPPACTTATLVSGADGASWLWADALLLGPTGQARIGALADVRSKSNPF